MDNGHQNAIFSSNPEVDDNLNEENWQRSLEISAPVDLPAPDQIAKTNLATENIESLTPAAAPAVTPENSSENAPVSESFSSPGNLVTPPNPTELGQIVPVMQGPNRQSSSTTTPQKYNPTNIRTTGDRLEKSTIPEIDNIITELNQTGNLNNFYDEIRGSDEKPGMMEVNLENSYGRKLGEAS